MHNGNGKGDARRPAQTKKEEVAKNWDRIFGGDRTMQLDPTQITVREDRLKKNTEIKE